MNLPKGVAEFYVLSRNCWTISKGNSFHSFAKEKRKLFSKILDLIWDINRMPEVGNLRPGDGFSLGIVGVLVTHKNLMKNV